MSDRRSSQSPIIQKSLKACTREGMAVQVTLSLLDTYLVPLALFFGAAHAHIGYLVGVPTVLSAISQFFAIRAIDHAGNRRRLILLGAAVQTAILLGLVVLLLSPDIAKIWMIIAMIALFRFMGGLIGPAWGSLVSEYLPEGRRGAYFGRRSQLIGIAGLAGVFLWGLALQGIEKVATEGIGFLVIFAVAMLFRLISISFLREMTDLHMKKPTDPHVSFVTFLSQFRKNSFVRFVFYIATVTFAIQLALPFFSVFLLQVRNLSYVEYSAVHFSYLAAAFLAYPAWGRYADRHGNAKVIRTAAFCIPFIPVLWILATNVVLLVAVEILSGTIMSGFTLGASNYIYDAVPEEHRARSLSYFNIINGTLAFLGASVGGNLIGVLPETFGHAIVTLFLVSAAIRFAAELFLSRRFGEVRAAVEPISSFQLFTSVVGLRPILGRAESFNTAFRTRRIEFYNRMIRDRRSRDRP